MIVVVWVDLFGYLCGVVVVCDVVNCFVCFEGVVWLCE